MPYAVRSTVSHYEIYMEPQLHHEIMPYEKHLDLYYFTWDQYTVNIRSTWKNSSWTSSRADPGIVKRKCFHHDQKEAFYYFYHLSFRVIRMLYKMSFYFTKKTCSFYWKCCKFCHPMSISTVPWSWWCILAIPDSSPTFATFHYAHLENAGHEMSSSCPVQGRSNSTSFKSYSLLTRAVDRDGWQRIASDP